MAGITLAGCALPTRVVTYNGLKFTMVIADADKVDRHCHRIVKRNDDGTLINPAVRIRCCFDGTGHGRGLMWVSNDAPDCVVHELVHADGKYGKGTEKINFYER